MEIKILTVLLVGAFASSITEAFSSPDRGGYQFIPGQVRSGPPSRNRYQFIPGRTSQNNRPLIGADIASLPPKDRPHSIRGRDVASLPPKDRPLIGGDIASLPPKDRPLIGGDIASLPPKDRPKFVGPGGIRPTRLGQGGRHQRSALSPLASGHRSAPSDEFSSEESAESYPSFIGGATARPSNKRGDNGGQGVRSSHY